MKRYFRVAQHVFCVSSEAEVFALMQNYEPFACEDGDVMFSLAVNPGEAPAYHEEMRQKDEGQDDDGMAEQPEKFLLIDLHACFSSPVSCRRSDVFPGSGS